MRFDIPVKLYANCIPVKGISRSIICDLQRNTIVAIPNDLFQIIELYEGKSIMDIQRVYENKYDSTILEYFEFLFENDLIFFTENPELFPKLNLDWDHPSEITNAIVEINENSKYDLFHVLDQLNDLNCPALELRFYNSVGIEKINLILGHLRSQGSSLVTIEILLPFSEEFQLSKLKNWFINSPRIAGLKIYDSSENKMIFPVRRDTGFIHYSMNSVTGNYHCGKISSKMFSINTPTFTESQKFNSCLNRKISVDVDGNIKNCPSMQENYGHINESTMKSVLSKEKFKRYWNINKDKVTTCKACEFRYICTDCRAFLEDPKDVLSKPLKCGYNPETNKWEQWSKNPLSQKAIRHYNLPNNTY